MERPREIRRRIIIDGVLTSEIPQWRQTAQPFAVDHRPDTRAWEPQPYPRQFSGRGRKDFALVAPPAIPDTLVTFGTPALWKGNRRRLGALQRMALAAGSFLALGSLVRLGDAMDTAVDGLLPEGRFLDMGMYKPDDMWRRKIDSDYECQGQQIVKGDFINEMVLARALSAKAARDELGYIEGDFILENAQLYTGPVYADHPEERVCTRVVRYGREFGVWVKVPEGVTVYKRIGRALVPVKSGSDFYLTRSSIRLATEYDVARVREKSKQPAGDLQARLVE